MAKAHDISDATTGYDHEDVPEEYKQRLLEIKRQYFKAGGYQYVDADTLIFLIGELHRFYFPSYPNVGYTDNCKTNT